MKVILPETLILTRWTAMTCTSPLIAPSSFTSFVIFFKAFNIVSEKILGEFKENGYPIRKLVWNEKVQQVEKTK